MHITFICTGNTCRSPMAEGIARKIAADHYPDQNWCFSSAGLATFNGAPASQHSIDVCREIGIDLSSHRSQRLNPEIAANTDLFAVMTDSHRNILLQCGIPAKRIALLGEGIPDPYGGDEEEYRACRDEIHRAVEQLLESLSETDDKERDRHE
ncbi:MAG: low molecular weight protein arginine phosphatase [Clostridia bacterium]|nr:low molecular weight protein arginine phosphatase [Clostridia bacterium]